MTNEELGALVKKNPIGFGCGVLSLLLIGGLYFRAGEIPAAELELQQKAAEAERYALNIKNSAQLKQQLDEITAANKTIDSRMVRVIDLATNQQYFRVLARDAGVNIVSFQQATMTAAPAKGAKTVFVPVLFNLTVQGTLPQTLNFLRAVENGAHYGRVLTATCGGNPANRNAPLMLALNLEVLGLP